MDWSLSDLVRQREGLLDVLAVLDRDIARYDDSEPQNVCYYTGSPHSYGGDPSSAGCDCREES